MRSLIKLTLILFCVHKREGHRLKTLTDKKQEAASTQKFSDGEMSTLSLEDSQSEADEVGPVLFPSVENSSKKRRSTPNSDCGLRSIMLKVRDLGLGYDSDESVLFKYCSGTCPRAYTNHDMTLNKLLQSGLLPDTPAGELSNRAPCCRPTHYDDTAFLDNSHRWHKVEKLFAAGCSCVG